MSGGKHFLRFSTGRAAPLAMLSLRIRRDGEEKIHAMRFMQDRSVGECLKDIEEKLGFSVVDCGLWQLTASPPRILNTRKTLQYYEIKSGVLRWLILLILHTAGNLDGQENTSSYEDRAHGLFN